MSAPAPSSPLAEPRSLAHRSWKRHAAIAASIYLVVALWAIRPVLSDVRGTLPQPLALAGLGRNWLELSLHDQMLTVAQLTANARRILTSPWALFDNGQCYPTPTPTALGEHMFGLGLLGALPYALTGDPILTTNVVVTLHLWLAGIAMYALVAYWTRSPGAALVAGLLFATQPTRLTNIVHPYVEANQWTPFALLAAHRLFTRARWVDAVALAAALVLQMLESFYTVIALALLGGTYGLVLSLRFRTRWRTVVPKLLAVVGAVLLVAAPIFVPYLRMRTWGALAGHGAVLYELKEYGPGGRTYPGSVTAALLVIALLDRLRHRRDERGYDPRLVVLAGGCLVLAASVYSLPLPFGWTMPSLFTLAARVVPGLDAIRAGLALSRGAVLAATFIAGYGMLALLEPWGARTRAVVTALLVVAAFADVFAPTIARREFGTVVSMAAHPVRPAAATLAVYENLPPGPVLDLPYALDARGIVHDMPEYVFLAAYHHRPVAACYNSFIVQVQHDLEALSARLPAASAVDAIAALGFRSIVVHPAMTRRGSNRSPNLAAATPGRLTLASAGTMETAYTVDPNVATTTSYDALAASDAPAPVTVVRPPQAQVPVTFRNHAAVVFRHPPPIVPTALLVRWQTAGDRVVAVVRLAELLPLALAPDDTMVRTLTLPVTVAAGDYELAVTRADAPDLVLARARVQVVAAPLQP